MPISVPNGRNARLMKTRPISPFRGSRSDAFIFSITGASTDSLGSYAEVGDHAGIGVNITPDQLIWSNENPSSTDKSGADPTYGTAAAPTAFTSGTLYAHARVGDDWVTRSLPIRYAPGSVTESPLEWELDEPLNVSLVSDFTTTNLTGAYVLTGLPTGAVDDNDGTISGEVTGTPTTDTFTATFTDQYGRTIVGNYSVDLVYRTQATAADGLGPFTWTVDDTPVAVNAATDFTLNGNTLTYSATGLPAGVTMNTSGFISGTPTAASSGSIVITGTDEYGRQVTSTTSHTTSLRTQATGGTDLDLAFPEDVAITATNLIQNWTLNGNDLTFVSVSPALPTGLSITAAGILQGTPTTVTADATYTLTMEDTYGRETSDTFTLEITVAGDSTAPTAAAIEAGTQTNGDLPVTIVDLDENSTLFWVLVPNLATAPNASEVIAGQASGGGAPSDSGNVAVTVGAGPYNFDLVSGLNGSFDLYTVFRDASLNPSIVYSDTAIPLDTTAPVISAVTVTPGDTQLAVDWSTDTANGTARIVAVPNGATAPNATEVLAGQASGGGAPSSESGVITVTASGAQTQAVLPDLVNNTAYDIYIAHRDLQLNVATPTSDLNHTPVPLGWDITAGDASATVNTFPTFSTTSWTIIGGDGSATVTVFPQP